MNNTIKQRRQFIKLASGLMVAPFASLLGVSASAMAAKPPLRMLTIVDSYGLPTATRNEIWVNSTAGDYALTGNELGSILSPLQAYKDNMLVVSGINLDSQIRTGSNRLHDQMNTHTLTGSRHIDGNTTKASAKIQHASIDVHIGQYLNSDYGLSRAHSHLLFTNTPAPVRTSLCYGASGNQIRSIAGPLQQAESIFANNTSLADLQFQNNTQQRIFDLVQKQIQSLRGQLYNANASTVMDAYQSSVNDLAAQIQLSSDKACGIPDELNTYSGGGGRESTTGTPYIFKNIQHAVACDLSSSLTYAIGSEITNNLTHNDLYDEEKHSSDELKTTLGRGLHAVSHLVTDVANKAHEVVRIHQSELLGDLLDDMSTSLDIDGSSVLDNTVIFWTSVMSGNIHKNEDYPYLLIAGKNTKLKGGFHYDCAGSTNNDLLTTIAQGMGLPDDRFGGHDGSGEYIDSLNNGPISKMLMV